MCWCWMETTFLSLSLSLGVEMDVCQKLMDLVTYETPSFPIFNGYIIITKVYLLCIAFFIRMVELRGTYITCYLFYYNSIHELIIVGPKKCPLLFFGDIVQYILYTTHIDTTIQLV